MLPWRVPPALIAAPANEVAEGPLGAWPSGRCCTELLLQLHKHTGKEGTCGSSGPDKQEKQTDITPLPSQAGNTKPGQPRTHLQPCRDRVGWDRAGVLLGTRGDTREQVCRGKVGGFYVEQRWCRTEQGCSRSFGMLGDTDLDGKCWVVLC